MIGEVYLTPAALNEANTILSQAEANQRAYFLAHPAPSASITAATLLKRSGSVTINGNILDKCTPKFSNVLSTAPTQFDERNPVTNDCEFFKNKYYYSGTTVPLYSLVSGAPWSFHTAGILCTDGSDHLSLENGARNSWLNNRGKNNHDQTLTLSPALTTEMNKTWYFRLYGPEERGQDIRQQTESHFM